jgi:hypothetical protein
MDRNEVNLYMPWFTQDQALEEFEELTMLEGKYGKGNAVTQISDLQEGDIVSVWNNYLFKEIFCIYIAPLDQNMGLFEDTTSSQRFYLAPSEESIYMVERKHKHKTDCECGAIHTSFPKYHLKFCPLDSKADK